MARASRMICSQVERVDRSAASPVSVKDLYGVEGMPTFAGTARRLPPPWETDGWLVSRLREQGAVFVGKTHTVELAFGAVGINPHWGTPPKPVGCRSGSHSGRVVMWSGGESLGGLGAGRAR